MRRGSDQGATEAESSPWQRERQRWSELGDSGEQGAPELEERTVEVNDPHLSPEANRALTEEVRATVGADRVRVPRERPHPSRGEEGTGPTAASLLSTHRLALILTLLAAITIGAIVSLSTNDWWWLALALGLHAFGTTAAAGYTLRLTTITEHPDPTVVARLEEEGVRNPEQRFTEIVSEFAPAPTTQVEASATDVISPGRNERTVPAEEDPATAAAEQRTAMTPRGGTSKPSRLLGVAGLMTFLVPLGLIGFSVAIPAFFGGGLLWLVTAVIVPCALGFAAVQVALDEHVGPFKGEERPRLLVPLIVAGAAAAVVIFAVVVAILYQGSVPR